MSNVKIETEMFGEKEHLMLRVGKAGLRVSREDLEELVDVMQEFKFESDKDLRECPECYCQDQWERNNFVLEMRCTQCDHEERRQKGIYYNEEHEQI